MPGKSRTLEPRPRPRKGAVIRPRPKPTSAAERTGDSQESRAGAYTVIGDRMMGSVDEASSELPSRVRTVFMPARPKSRPVEVRASVVALKRLITVEPRDAGK